MNIHIIACQVFYRDLSYLAALSNHSTSVTWMPQGLHDTPDLLRISVQAEIDRIDTAIDEKSLKRDPDCILIGYGLCSNGTVGLSSRHLPLIVPKTDDCIGVFLGSQARYLEQFEAHPGTYWFNNGWLETSYLPNKKNYQQRFDYYAEQYGEDNAEFLLEQENGWVDKYNTCGYISSEVYENDGFIAESQDICDHNGWDFLQLQGDLSYLKRLLDGTFTQKEALVCPAGCRVEASFDEQKLKASDISA